MSVPPSPKTDIIISIHPQYVAAIAERTKTHEFRNYTLPVSVNVLWIYTTAPASSITHRAVISAAKQPGGIANPKCEGDHAFNCGDKGSASRAYEILRLDKLRTPISLSELKARGWLRGAPQKYVFANSTMQESAVGIELDLVFDTADEWAARRLAGGPAAHR